MHSVYFEQKFVAAGIEASARAWNPWFLYRKCCRSVVRVHRTNGLCIENVVGATVFAREIAFVHATPFNK